jgi:hypothetical protein
MIDVTNRPYIHVRLRPLKLLLRHRQSSSLKGKQVNSGSPPEDCSSPRVAAGGDT